MREHWLVLKLNPEPWKIGPVSVIRKAGKVIPVVGRDAQLDAFKNAVAEQVRNELGIGDEESFYFEGPTKLTIYLWRQRAAYETPQSRTHRKHEADATNMLKATEDALQGIFYKNDKDNHEVRAVIFAQGENVTPAIIIHIEEFDPSVWTEIPNMCFAKLRGEPPLF